MYLDLIGFISEYTTIGSSNLISVGNREHKFTDRLWKIWYTLINLVLTHSRVLNHLERKGHIWVSKLWRTKLLPITCSYYLITCLSCLTYIIYYLYICTFTQTHCGDNMELIYIFESSAVQLRSKEDLEGPECSNYC